MDSLIEKVRSAMSSAPEGQGFDVTKVFTPKDYQQYAQFFRLPTIYNVIEKLSYDRTDPIDIQIDKYIALLIGLREISRRPAPSGQTQPEAQQLILTKVMEKLREFSFYQSEHESNALQAGKGYGHEDYVPPFMQLLPQITKQKAR